MARREFDRTSAEILKAARDMITFAQQGMRDYLEKGARSESGLFAAITSARIVTMTLQGLNTRTADGGSWWVAHSARLRADPVARWFWELRNDIEKRGTLGPHGISMTLNLSTRDLPPPPPGAKRQFVGDQLGRSGWEVSLPDGSTDIVYFSLPEENLRIERVLPDAPDGAPLERLLPSYLAQIESIVEDAEQVFGSAVDGPRR
jgi:hypothetical protein